MTKEQDDLSAELLPGALIGMGTTLLILAAALNSGHTVDLTAAAVGGFIALILGAVGAIAKRLATA